MLSFVCLLLAVFGAAYSVDGQPSRCCFDSKFTALVGNVGASAADATHLLPVFGTIALAYDYDQQLMGTTSKMRQPDGHFSTSVELFDYRDKRAYTFKHDGTCTYRAMANTDVMFGHCVPDNATFMSNFTFGYGAQSIVMNSWEVSDTLPDGSSQERIVAVSTDNCAPVMQYISATYGGKQTMLTYYIFNYQPGIDPQNALTRPTTCTAESTDPAVGRR